jgi:hypothetical protein
LLATAAIDAPRFEYDANGNPLGLLIEGARTNSLFPSNDFSGWNASNVTVLSDASIAPDGSTNVTKIEATGTSNVGAYPNGAINSGLAFSVFAKADTTPFLCIGSNGAGQAWAYFDLESATVGNLADCSATITDVGNGWCRCSVIPTDAMTFRIVSPMDSMGNDSGWATPVTPGKSILVFGAQQEDGPTASSYIPTTDAPVTRAADNVSMTGTNFSSWYDQDQGTWATQVSYSSIGVQRGVLELQNVNIPMRIEGNNSITAYLDGTIVGGVAIQPFSSLAKIASRYTKGASASIQPSFNGVLGFAGVGSNSWINDTLTIGNRGGVYLFGHIQRLAYWSRELTDAEMIDVTGGGVGTHIYPTTNEGALQIEVDGIPHSYNGGVGYTIDERVCARLNATPDPNDGYVAGVRVTPEGLVHFVTNTPPPVSDGFSTGFSNGYGA